MISNVSFFQEISNSFNQVVNKYENMFLAGDLSIDLLDSKSDLNDNFSVLKDTYNMTNLVKVLTCYNFFFFFLNFNETVFLHELDQKRIQRDLCCSDDPYYKLTEIFHLFL